MLEVRDGEGDGLLAVHVRSGIERELDQRPMTRRRREDVDDLGRNRRQHLPGVGKRLRRTERLDGVPPDRRRDIADGH